MASHLPSWFKQDIPGKQALALAGYFKRASLHTVCRETRCPNWGVCYGKNTAAFIILGDTCTRNCSFCAVKKTGESSKLALDPTESRRIAEAARRMRLKYIVVTSVTRDDLDDGGAGLFAQTTRQLRLLNKGINIELLIPDFNGDTLSLKKVTESLPQVIGHNLETVERLYDKVRPQADYRRSLRVLSAIKELNPRLLTKSSLMLGMGEREAEIKKTLRDLSATGCDILVLGQYLCPAPGKYPVRDFVSPQRFAFYERLGYALGFKMVLSGPKVRSSFMAEKVYRGMSNA